jgi:hypothetical protein
MIQCAARQFENELVERLSILADRHLRPPAPEGGTVSTAVYCVLAPFRGLGGVHKHFWDFIFENTTSIPRYSNFLQSTAPGSIRAQYFYLLFIYLFRSAFSRTL